MTAKPDHKHHIHREHIGGNKITHEITTITNNAGEVLHRIVRPLRLEFHPQDIVQVIVGATILATPIALTEEVWVLGATLPLWNILFIGLASLFFIGLFTFYTYYRHHFSKYRYRFLIRVLITYCIALFVVGLLLAAIGQGPWLTEWMIALKRTVLIAFPASMSAAIADTVHGHGQ